MKTNRLKTSEEEVIVLPYAWSTTKEICPEGYEYSGIVSKLALNLYGELKNFHKDGSIINYEIYPFLITRSLIPREYRDYHAVTERAIVESRFDMESFNEWMDELSIPLKIRNMIKSEVCVYYRSFTQKGKLDLVYLDVMMHLINSFKTLNNGYKLAQCELQEIYKIPIGFHRHTSLNYYLTFSYLMKNVKRFNKKQGAPSGKYLSVSCNGKPDDIVIVNCEKYNKK